MSLNLQNTINYAETFIQYSPLTAGNGMEPAVSAASMIRNSILMPGNTWSYNRSETTFTTVAGQQDYNQNITTGDFSYIEKATLTDDSGKIYEIKDVYNWSPLAVSAFQQRPSAISVQSITNPGNPSQSVKFRFLGVPDAVYTVTITYQKLSPQFGPFFITSASNAVSGNTTYTGTFDPISFPVGSTAVITGFTNSVNNGSFSVVSVSTTQLVLANPSGVLENTTAYAANLSWDPIPDSHSDIYNNLFLFQALAAVDDPRASLYRQLGVAAFMARATGLSETQKNIFAQQWLARDREKQAAVGVTQVGITAKGV